MNVLVIGGAGRTGFQVVTQALAAGHTVTAFVRDKRHLRLGDQRLSLQVGDARDVTQLLPALEGQDVVISVLGTLRAKDKLQARAMEALIPAMRAAKVKRVVLLSSLLNAPGYTSKGWQKLADLALKGVHADKRAGEELLKRSELDWTIVFATTLTNGPEKNWHPVKPGTAVSLGNRITRAAAADCLLRLAVNRRAHRRSLVVTAS